MPAFKRILVIADQQPGTEDSALAHALRLGEKSSVTVAGFVYDEVVEHDEHFSKRDALALQRELKQRERTVLEKVVKGLALKRVKAEVVWTRHIHEWVREACEAGRFDLVVKTGHRTERFWYTPTDWQLLRSCPVPVYIVARRQWRARPSVLAAVDVGSDKRTQRKLDHRVIDHAKACADELGATVHLGYVVPVSQVVLDLEVHTRKEYIERFQQKHGKRLKDLAKKHGVDPEHVHVEVGPPERMIPRMANRIHAELVVMGSRGRKGLKGALLGNTAEQVLNVLRTDVLAIRP